MENKTEFRDYVLDDLLSEIDGITARAMFGGFGVYKDGIIFGLIAYDTLYFKVDDTNRENYEIRGSRPFTYKRKNHPQTTMSYYQLPPEIMDDKEEIEKWVSKSVLVSLHAKKKSRKKAKKN